MFKAMAIFTHGWRSWRIACRRKGVTFRISLISSTPLQFPQEFFRVINRPFKFNARFASHENRSYQLSPHLPRGRVGGKQRVERPGAKDRLLPAPYQTGRAVFPHPAFRVSFFRWACAAWQKLVKIQETFGAGSRDSRPSPLRHFASLHRHKCPPLAPRGLSCPTDQRYYGGLRLLPQPARPSPLRGLCRQLAPAPPEQVSPLTCASLPGMSPTPTPPVYCRSPRRLVWSSTLRPSPNFEGLGCREDYFEAHLCGSYTLRPAGSTPCSPPASRRRSWHGLRC
jgi:hypothetical protein